MTDENEDLTYFWQEVKFKTPFKWHEKSYFLSVAEWASGEINEQTKALTKRFTIIYDKDKELGDYFICNFCKERVERGVFNISDHLDECKVK